MNIKGIYSEICGWVSNIVIFVPLLCVLFMADLLGLSEFLKEGPVEDLP